MAASPARVRLLGAVTLEVPGGAAVDLGRRLRTLLALLAVEAGGVVAVESLLDEIWGEKLPERPDNAVQVLISRLRRESRTAGVPLEISAVGEAYRLELPREAVDLHRFHAGVAGALRPDEDQDAALRAGREALAAWRGEPFAGIPLGERLDLERTRARLRLPRVVARVAGILLDRGSGEEAVDVVVPYAAADPGDEPLARLAAVALHRSGRTPEALDLLEATRRHFREELDLEPSPELTDLAEQLAVPVVIKSAGRLTGRDDELAGVRALLEAPHAGTVQLVTGEAGIGKTALLRAAVEQARARGVIAASGSFDVGAPPWSCWAEVLDGLGAAPLSPDEPAVGPALRRRIAVRRAEAPVLLTLDDLHHADSASLSALRALARLGLPPGVVLLAAAREPDVVAHPAWSATRADLALVPGVVDTTLAELDEDAVRALVAERLRSLGPEGHERVARALWMRTGGHALHVAALVETLEGCDDRDGDRACRTLARAVPARLRPLFAHLLAGLARESREVVEAMAVLAPIAPRDLAATLDLEPRELARRLRPGVERGLVVADGDGFAFRHSLTHDAIRATVPAATAAALHHARWKVLSAAPDAEPFALLRRAVGAGSLLRRDAVDDARLGAAVASYRSRALVETLELLDARADPLTPGTAVLYRGLALEALGRLDEADDVLDVLVARAEADPGQIADAVVAAVGHDPLGVAFAGRPRRAQRLRRVRALALDVPQRAAVLRALVLEEERLFEASTPDPMAELSALTGEIDDRRLHAGVRVLEAHRLVDAPVSAAERLAVSATAVGEAATVEGDELGPLGFEAAELCIGALLAAGRLEDALAARDALADAATTQYHPRSIWMTMLLSASLLVAGGRPEEAHQAAVAARNRGREMGLPDADISFQVHLVARHWLNGTLPLLGGIPAKAAARYPNVAAWSAAAAVDALQAGDRDGAAAHLAEWHRKRDGREGRLFDRSGLCLAAAAAFVLGDVATARVVVDTLPADPGATVAVGAVAQLGPVALYRGLAFATLHDLAHARRRFGFAAELAERLGWTPWVDAARRLARWVSHPVGSPSTPPDALPLGLVPPP